LAFTACSDSANWDAVGLEPGRRRQLEIRCAVLPVPLDHARPDRGTLPMAVMRVRSSRQHDRLGSLVLNPGGPGVSGLDSMPGWAAWFPDVLLDRFDLVTFDPRGTGASSPIDCAARSGGQDEVPLPDVMSQRGFAAEQARSSAHATACARVIAAAGGVYGTDAVARDLDRLRLAIGDERLTYVGWSYGARLGAQYAHLFPDRVRALVLDSPPHPTATLPAVVSAQLGAFESTFAAYVDGCPSRDTCALTAGIPRTVFDRVVRIAREHPIRSGRPAGDPPATWDVVVLSVMAHLAAPESWPALDRALYEADQGDSGSLYEMLDSIRGKTPAHPATDTSDVRLVIQCTDAPPAGDVSRLRAQAARLVHQYPTFGPFDAWWLFACTTWTAPRVPLPAPTTSTTAPILVIGGRADPVTPLAGARALAQVLGPTAVLLTSARPGHTSFGRSECVEHHVVQVLVDADVPGTGTACP
jgi:pimeloyl-ACP methyl ester carboxylesterase